MDYDGTNQSFSNPDKHRGKFAACRICLKVRVAVSTR